MVAFLPRERDRDVEFRLLGTTVSLDLELHDKRDVEDLHPERVQRVELQEAQRIDAGDRLLVEFGLDHRRLPLVGAPGRHLLKLSYGHR